MIIYFNNKNIFQGKPANQHLSCPSACMSCTQKDSRFLEKEAFPALSSGGSCSSNLTFVQCPLPASVEPEDCSDLAWWLWNSTDLNYPVNLHHQWGVTISSLIKFEAPVLSVLWTFLTKPQPWASVSILVKSSLSKNPTRSPLISDHPQYMINSLILHLQCISHPPAFSMNPAAVLAKNLPTLDISF